MSVYENEGSPILVLFAKSRSISSIILKTVNLKLSTREKSLFFEIEGGIFMIRISNI
jgi:hypothetical protein